MLFVEQNHGNERDNVEPHESEIQPAYAFARFRPTEIKANRIE